MEIRAFQKKSVPKPKKVRRLSGLSLTIFSGGGAALIAMECTDPERLLALAKEGDGDALGRLIERHRDYLILLTRMKVGRSLRGKLDPEDILQEMSLEAHRAIGRFRGSSELAFRAWLRQILAAVLSNQIRRFHGTKGRDPRLERSLAEDLDRSSRALRPGPDRAAELPEPAGRPPRAGSCSWPRPSASSRRIIAR